MQMKKNLHDWLKHIETAHPQVMDLGLQRITRVAEAMHLLPYGKTVITVAGTNGKGSCVRLLETILSTAGYTVGSYTSPHLLHYNERIRIEQQDADDTMLCEAFTQIEKACTALKNDNNIETEKRSLTYFEYSTLAALYLFKQKNVEVAILEVGLGGRLDAVNIVDADISVITSIALDHMDILGTTRESIAKEKAGIMRPNKPVICGDFNPPENLSELAKAMQADFYCQGRDFHFTVNTTDWTWRSRKKTFHNLPLPQLRLQNVATVLQVIELLPSNLTVCEQAIRQGIQQATLTGRQQVIAGKISTIVDVAHNPASAEVLAEFLQNNRTSGKTYAVFSIFKDKDIQGTVLPMQDLVANWYIARLDNTRAASIAMIKDGLLTQGITQIDEHETVVQAYQHALMAASLDNGNNRIVVFGSFHTVERVLKYLNQEE